MKLQDGQVAVVTGGASGIGLALAEAFAERGLAVVLADIEQPALDDATRQLADKGATVLGVRTDVSAAGQVETLAGTVMDRFGRVDALVNNAGVMLKARTPFQDISYEDWRWLVDVNLWGVIHGLRAFVPLLADQGHGHIVNVASEAGIVPAVSGVAPYSVTSHAVVGLSETLAADLAEQAPGIGVTVLCPGLVAGTRLIDSARNRPGGRGPAMDPGEPPPGLVMLDPRAIAEETLTAIEDNRLHLAVGEGIAHGVRARVDRLLADVNAHSPAGTEKKGMLRP
jgi:NAD(P)-dependent dehydrogenase (short-subunit alcohol dehydrogenase family)